MQRRHLIQGLGASALAATVPLRLARAAAVGQPAPGFTLTDVHGQAVRLADFQGKLVVLEWNNPGCPFVRKHYQGNMQALQKAYTAQGVAWLAINSTETASGDYLSPPQLARWMDERQAAPSAVLMDESGAVGRAYGARATPHMYLIDAAGRLAYAGAIDSIASARVADIAKATNYVRQGLDELLAGRPVSRPQTTAYGCGIKYQGA